MHYCISMVLNHKLQINNDQFILGGLAPDVHKNMNEPKGKSHFLKRDAAGISHVEHHIFFDKYLARNRTPFHLGYYFHLISDEVWLREIYFKKIKWLPQGIKQEAQNKYYRDFRRLNGKLIDYYSLELVPLKEQPIEIDEINYALLPELVRGLENDFKMADSVKGEPLEILELEEIIQTIEKSVLSCVSRFEEGINFR
jgi:hypothetical protein